LEIFLLAGDKLNINELKEAAAVSAVDFVKSGMIVGLGTGSTTYFAIKEIAERIKDGRLKNIKGIPSSIQTEKLAIEVGIKIVTFKEENFIDLTIDGADEVDINLNLIKGGGGALLREKIIAQASRRNIIIVDESKLSQVVGTKWHLPIEVIPFALHLEINYLRQLNGNPKIRKRKDGENFLTDQDNFIVDCNFGKINDVNSLSLRLNDRAGIVEHGLFIGSVTDLIVAHKNGVAHFEKNKMPDEIFKFTGLIQR